jgi:excisionase family DNA binding protein
MKIRVRPNLLTVQEVATHLSVSPRTVYRLMRDYKLPAYRVGGQWRFKLEAIEAWMSEEHGQASRADFNEASDATELIDEPRHSGRRNEERVRQSAARSTGGSESDHSIESVLLLSK